MWCVLREQWLSAELLARLSLRLILSTGWVVGLSSFYRKSNQQLQYGFAVAVPMTGVCPDKELKDSFKPLLGQVHVTERGAWGNCMPISLFTFDPEREVLRLLWKMHKGHRISCLKVCCVTFGQSLNFSAAIYDIKT